MWPECTVFSKSTLPLCGPHFAVNIIVFYGRFDIPRRMNHRVLCASTHSTLPSTAASGKTANMPNADLNNAKLCSLMRHKRKERQNERNDRASDGWREGLLRGHISTKPLFPLHVCLIIQHWRGRGRRGGRGGRGGGWAWAEGSLERDCPAKAQNYKKQMQHFWYSRRKFTGNEKIVCPLSHVWLSDISQHASALL